MVLNERVFSKNQRLFRAVIRCPIHTGDILKKGRGIGYNNYSLRKEDSDMSGKRILLKIALSPVILILLILKVIVKIGIGISSIVLGGMILFTIGCIIYTIVHQTWSQTFVLFLVEGGVIVVTIATGLIESLVDAALRGLLSL